MYTWQFEQIEGDDRMLLQLSGYAAPFGRPRKDPVLPEKLRSRVQTVRYPGKQGTGTRNAFGTHWEQIELKGRWMDRHLATKTANSLANDWTRFFNGERTVRISWGPIVSYTGFMSELDLDRESEHEIAWKMVFLIDARDDVVKMRDLPPPLSAKETLSEVIGFLYKDGNLSGGLALPGSDVISSSLFDTLDNIASAVNSPIAELNRLAGEFDKFEKATFSTIAHFRSAITGAQVALQSMRDTVLDANINATNLGQDLRASGSGPRISYGPDSALAWGKFRAEFDNNSAEVLALLAFLDKSAELQGKSEASKIIVAEENETWESLAIRSGAGLSKVSEIRKLNGARYGERPVAGQTYLIP